MHVIYLGIINNGRRVYECGAGLVAFEGYRTTALGESLRPDSS